MVRLLETSSISAEKYPTLNQWDLTVRRNYDMYQRLIDAKTYQLQRIQRYILSLSYPRKYDSDLITLDLLKKKQRIGQVSKKELQTYSHINPSIRRQYSKTFGSFQVPQTGLFIGTGLLIFGSLFNFSIPTRAIHFALPIVADYFWSRRNPKSEIASAEFLDWVFEYRKAKVFNQRYGHLFSDPQTKKALGNSNIAALGQQYIKLVN